MDSNSIREWLSIGPGLVSRWLSCFKVLGFDHPLLYGANAAWDMQWRFREKTKLSRASWKGKFFSSSWILNGCFLFCFWENVLFNSHVASYVTCSCRKTLKTIIHRCSPKQVFLTISQYSQEKNVAASFWKSFRTEGLHFYLKRDSNASVFLWILRNF